MSITLEFHDAGLAATGVAAAPAIKWSQAFTSDQEIPAVGGSTVILLTPPLHPFCNACGWERGGAAG